MPQVCTVCTHPNAAQINLALIRREGSKRGIASRYGIDDAAIYRHESDHLSEKLARAQASREAQERIDLNAELEACFEFVRKLRAACDDWLTDPEYPENYTLDARDEDIDVIYKEKTGERRDGTPLWERKRAKLSRLLASLESDDIDVQRSEFKHSDPRKLILECLDRMDKHMRMLGDLTGAFVAPATNPADTRLAIELVQEFCRLFVSFCKAAPVEAVQIIEMIQAQPEQFEAAMLELREAQG